ncbi:MAG: hypothetical protein M0019_07465 [Actinomycetota bacterium]|nr:hypothetical protein [Actinomycetota bacterium]
MDKVKGERENLSHLSTSRQSSRRISVWSLLIRFPTRFEEIVVLYLLPLAHLRALKTRREDLHKVIRRGRVRSLLDGAITGTSFYGAIPAALVSAIVTKLYEFSLIAIDSRENIDSNSLTLHYLVVSGIYPSLDEASKGISQLRESRDEGAKVWESIRQVPKWFLELLELAGVQYRWYRSSTLSEKINLVFTLLAFFFPFVGAPFWARAYYVSNRGLVSKSVEYFSMEQGDYEGHHRDPFRLRRVDNFILVGIIVLMVAFFAGAVVLSIAFHFALGRRYTKQLLIGDLLLVVYSIRLGRILFSKK